MLFALFSSPPPLSVYLSLDFLPSFPAQRSAEVAMNWVLEHMGDSDFNDPLPTPGATAAPAADPESLATLAGFGFTGRQASAALKATGGDVARGADWLFSHTGDDLDKAVAEVCVCACARAMENNVPVNLSLSAIVRHRRVESCCKDALFFRFALL